MAGQNSRKKQWNGKQEDNKDVCYKFQSLLITWFCRRCDTQKRWVVFINGFWHGVRTVGVRKHQLFDSGKVDWSSKCYSNLPEQDGLHSSSAFWDHPSWGLPRFNLPICLPTSDRLAYIYFPFFHFFKLSLPCITLSKAFPKVNTSHGSQVHVILLCSFYSAF